MIGNWLHRHVPPTEAPVTVDQPTVHNDKEAGVPNVTTAATRNDADSETDLVSENVQTGVQIAQATNQVWSRNHLIMAYAFIWIIYFVDSLNSGISTFLGPYVTSDFQEHSLTATTQVMSSLIGGVSKLTLAKILDIWGRPQGFLLSTTLLTIGLVAMAACNGVATYAAAQVFYWVGFQGISYTMTIFIADTSALKNRGLVLAFVSSPYLVTTWITSPVSQSVLETVGWRWGFGILSIVTPVMCLPLFSLFIYTYLKAKKQGLMPSSSSGRKWYQSISHYFWEFDVICLILVTGGFALFLLPFNIYSKQPYGWRDPTTLAPLCVGFAMLVASVIWEKYWAPVKFMPWELLTDRTVVGACILAAILFVEYYIWNSLFTSFLQVALDMSVTNSGYVANTYTIGSCLVSFAAGMVLRKTGRYKSIALYFGVPFTILGVGLMIYFRSPGTKIGYIVMCQVFIALAGGVCVICEQVAVMAVASHQHLAVVLAVESMFSSVGGAIGGSVATAIWTGVFPKKLAEYLPEGEAQENLAAIYGSIYKQLSYPMGSPTREAINMAYFESQKYMLIGATAITVLGIPAVMMWRDIDVRGSKQVKGRVI